MEENKQCCCDSVKMRLNGCKIYSPTETPFELEMLKDKLLTIDWSKIRMPSKSDLTDLLMKRILSNMSPDCTVVIGDEVFNCHLLVLKCYSKYFDSSEGNKFSFEPEKVSARAFSFIYHWMIESEPNNYTSLSKENILEIYLASYILGIEELDNQCKAFIGCEEMRTEEAAATMYLSACQLGDKYIANVFECNVLTYFFTLVSSQNFLKLSPGVLCDLLKSNYITVNSEFEVFMSAVRWLMHDWEERKPFLVDVMLCIRFGHIAPWQLVDILRNPQNPEFILVSSNYKVQKMIEEGLRYATLKHGCGNKSQNLHSILCLESLSPRNWIDMGKSYNLYQHFLADLELHRRHHNNPLLEPTFAKKFCRMNELLLLQRDSSSFQSYSTDISNIVSNDKYKIQAQSTTKCQSSSLYEESINADPSKFEKPDRIMFSDDQYQERQNTEVSERLTFSSYEESINHIPPEIFEKTQRIKFSNELFQERQSSAMSESSENNVSVDEVIYSKEYQFFDNAGSSKGDQPIHDPSLKSFDVYFLPEVGGPFRKWSQVVAEGNVIKRNYLAEGSLFYKKRDAVLILGGIDQNEQLERKSNLGKDIYRFHPEGNFWELVGELPEPRHHHCVALLKGYVFVVGGADPRKDSIRTHSTVVGTVWSFDPITRCWCSENGLLTPRKNFALVVCDGKLYAIGGQDRNEIPLSSVEKFDPASGIWQEVAPMNKGRTGLAATKYKDLIWVAGGITGTKKSNNRRVTGSVECYDPKLNIWIPGKFLQFPICFGQLFAKYDTLYVIGGAGRKSDREQNTASIGSIHAWNEETQEWSLRTELAIPRHSHSVSYLATQMLIIGGVTTIYMKSLRNIECYCCERRTWIRGIAELPINVTGHDSLTLPSATMMNLT